MCPSSIASRAAQAAVSSLLRLVVSASPRLSLSGLPPPPGAPLAARPRAPARCPQLQPEVGGVPLAAAYLLGLALPRQDGPVAPGTTRAGGCPVGVGVSPRPTQTPGP